MFEELQKALGYEFRNIILLRNALDRTHRVRAGDAYTSRERILPDYEHLERLGDTALNLSIMTILSDLHPTWTPGQLNKAYVHYTRNTSDYAVHGSALYRIAKDLKLETYLTLKPGESLDEKGKRGKPEDKREGKTKEGHLSDHMEAVFGAIYTDAGYDLNVLRTVIANLYKPLGLLDPDHDSDKAFGASSPFAAAAAVAAALAAAARPVAPPPPAGGAGGGAAALFRRAAAPPLPVPPPPARPPYHRGAAAGGFPGRPYCRPVAPAAVAPPLPPAYPLYYVGAAAVAAMPPRGAPAPAEGRAAGRGTPPRR